MDKTVVIKPENPDIVRVNRGQIRELRSKVKDSLNGRARILCHKSPDDSIQEMIIVHKEGAYNRPHKHNDSESFHIISGCATIVLFCDDGSIKETILMGDYKSGKNFYYRLNRPLYHTMIIHSPTLILHETVRGPFKKDNMMFAPWSPEEGMNAKEFMKELEERIK
jgi:cupin fold WbuC family metalloprotein